MAVLALVNTLQKNRSSWAKTPLLINRERVESLYKDEAAPTTKSIMIYNIGDGERGGTIELQLNHYVNTVATRLNEDETNPMIIMNVLYYKEQGFMREKATTTNTKQRRINADSIIYAYNISTTQAYVFCQRGLNWIRYTVSHTVEDISRAYSTSASLSAS